MIWWWDLGYKDGWTNDSVIKFGCEVNIRSIHEDEVSNICVGSLITWCKANCDDFLLLYLHLWLCHVYTNYLISRYNRLEALLRKDYFALQTQDLAQSFL